MMRVVSMSDIHIGLNFTGFKGLSIPDGDVLVIAGDICITQSLLEIGLLDKYLATLPHHHKLIIAGNHDFPIARLGKINAKAFFKNAIYLEDEGIEIDGLKFWGSPWQPEFFNWAFNLPRGGALAEKWHLIPDDTHVLITHGPPMGILDQTSTGESVGCQDLRKAVSRIKPLLHIFGHIHESYGVAREEGITFVNAAMCNEGYHAINPPIFVDIST